MDQQKGPLAGERCAQSACRRDAVKEDRAWKEQLWSDKKGINEWERKWGFLKAYDQLGWPKFEKPTSSDTTPVYDRMPITTNRVYGSRLSNQLAVQIVRLDRLLVGRPSHRKHKMNFEMKPF